MIRITTSKEEAMKNGGICGIVPVEENKIYICGPIENMRDTSSIAIKLQNGDILELKAIDDRVFKRDECLDKYLFEYAEKIFNHDGKSIIDIIERYVMDGSHAIWKHRIYIYRLLRMDGADSFEGGFEQTLVIVWRLYYFYSTENEVYGQ